MNPSEQTCDLQRISDYLDERLDEADLAAFETHLTDCVSCQGELQQRAAEPEVWSDAARLLGHEDSIPTSDGTIKKHERQIASVLDALAPTDDPDMLGRIGEYEVSGIVGVGGMGAVLKGFDRSLRRVVAIKVMAPHLADSGSARNRFRREARAAAAITHDNVIEIYGVSEANELPYLVMPFARGPSLQARIDESGPMTATEVVRIGRQIAAGLAAAHEQGLVHRDIKPANILLSEGIERLWITDFGVARAIDDASMTQTGLIAGTPQYMSPEQARGDTVDHRSDLFSLGSIMYTACTGHPPFRSEAAYGILRRITDTDPRPIRDCNPEIPGWLCAFIERLMAKHPSDRFQTAQEVAELLEGCLAHLQQPTQVELPPCVAAGKQSDVLMSDSPRREHLGQQHEVRSFRLSRKGAWLMGMVLSFAGLSALAIQMTAPVNVSGQWAGESWRNVTLSSVDEASDWYTGAFTDAEGQTGALHLEWSRLQRRYNGRWKVGDDTAGSITLRADGISGIRGAISVDPDSQLTADAPRLREFSWKRSSSAVTTAGQVKQEANAVTQRSQAIQSPVKGRISKVGEGISEGAQVSKDQLILKIQDQDPQYRNRLEQQYRSNLLSLQSQRDQLGASERKVDAMQASVKAAESRVVYHEQVISELQDAHARITDAARKQLEANQALRDAREESLKQAQTELRRVEQLHGEGISPESELQQAKVRLEEAKALLAASDEVVSIAQQNLATKESEGKLKLLKAQSDLDQAESDLKKSKVEVTKAAFDVQKMRVVVSRDEKQVSETKRKLAAEVTQEVEIRAPRDGVITELVNLSENMITKAGDKICVITPTMTKEERSREGATSNDAQPARPDYNDPGVPTYEPAKQVLRLPRVSGETITESINAASSLSQRLREIRQRLELAKKTEPTAKDRSTVTKLEQQLAVLERERSAATEILQEQLEEAKRLTNSRKGLSDFVNARVKQGELSKSQALPAEQVVAASEAELRQIELLLKYYTKMGEQDTLSPDVESSLASEILQVQLEAAKTQLAFLTMQRELKKRLFDDGHGDIEDLVALEQEETKAATEVRTVEAIIKYYQQESSDASKSAP